MEKNYHQQPVSGENILHVELVQLTQMRIILKGDPVLISKMISTAMDSRQDICAAMIAGVCAWFEKNNMPISEIGNMVKFK